MPFLASCSQGDCVMIRSCLYPKDLLAQTELHLFNTCTTWAVV
jgi:hypothetical protein